MHSNSLEITYGLSHHWNYKKQSRLTTNSFRFFKVYFNLLEAFSIPITTSKGAKRILVDIDIFKADIPALIGLKVHDLEYINADTAFKYLVNSSDFPLENYKKICMENWFILTKRT